MSSLLAVFARASSKVYIIPNRKRARAIIAAKIMTDSVEVS